MASSQPNLSFLSGKGVPVSRLLILGFFHRASRLRRRRTPCALKGQVSAIFSFLLEVDGSLHRRLHKLPQILAPIPFKEVVEVSTELVEALEFSMENSNW